MLERLKNLKSSVRYFVANYKNDQDSLITAEVWQLVNHIILLYEPLFVTKSLVKTMQRDPACKITDEVC